MPEAWELSRTPPLPHFQQVVHHHVLFVPSVNVLLTRLFVLFSNSSAITMISWLDYYDNLRINFLLSLLVTSNPIHTLLSKYLYKT